MDLVIPDFEAEASNIRPDDLAQMAGVDVDDALTSHADEVMMLFDPRIEPRGRSGVADLCDQAQFHKGVENAIHRGPRDDMNALTHPLVHLIGRRMVLPLDQQREDGLPLRGHGKAARTAYMLKLPDPVWTRFTTHGDAVGILYYLVIAIKYPDRRA